MTPGHTTEAELWAESGCLLSLFLIKKGEHKKKELSWVSGQMTFWSNSFYSLHQSIQHGTNDSRYCDSGWLHFFQGKVNTQETEYTKEGSIYFYKNLFFFYSNCYKNHKDCISIILIWLKVRKLICIVPVL